MKMKKTIVFSILLLFILILQSFQSSNKKEEILAAKTWFISNIYQTNFELDWDNASIEKKGSNNQLVIDIPITNMKSLFNVSKTKGNHNDIASSNGASRVVIIKEPNGVYKARVLKIVADDTFMRQGGNRHRNIKFNPYDFLHKKFSGYAWFEDFNGHFIEGVEFSNGQKSSLLTIVNNSTIAGNQLSTRSMQYCTSYEVDVQGYYNNGTANVVVFTLTFTICTYDPSGGATYSLFSGGTNFDPTTSGISGTSSNNDWNSDSSSSSTNETGCNSNCQNSVSKGSCYVTWYVLSNEVKRVTTYINAYLTDCKFGLSEAKTFSQGANATIVEGDTQLSVASRQKLGSCKWRFTFISRPKIVWQPTTVEVSLMIGQYGADVGFNTSPKTEECGPYNIAIDLGY